MDQARPTRARKLLVQGRMMRCPRCKRTHDILQYIRLEMIEEFASETTPVYKSPCCKWIFAPADPLAFEQLLELVGRIEELERSLVARRAPGANEDGEKEEGSSA